MLEFQEYFSKRKDPWAMFLQKTTIYQLFNYQTFGFREDMDSKSNETFHLRGPHLMEPLGTKN